MASCRRASIPLSCSALLALRLRGTRVGTGRSGPRRAEEEAVESAPEGQHVPIDAASYIPVPPEVLQEKLGRRLASSSEEAPAEWQKFCDQLSEQIRHEIRPLRMNLKDAYQPFDPVRRRWVGSWPLPEKEVRFAQEFLRAASLAGFTPLSRYDLEKTRELKADLLSLPVTILWDRLDSRWIEAVFEEGVDSTHTLEALSDFGGYVLALKRGVAVDLKSGLLLTQKLECLQSQWLLRIGSLMRAMLRKLSQLSIQVWTQMLWPTARGLAEEFAEERGSNQRLQRTLRFLKSCGQRAQKVALAAREQLRGLRMRLAGTQVLRSLQPGSYRYAQWLFGDVMNARWSEERQALIKRLAKAWEQEVALRGHGAALSEDSEARSKAIEEGNYLQRVSVEHLSYSWRSLLQPAELREPQFQEILIAYRLQVEGGVGLPRPLPRREICVRRFFEVAMKDIKLVLPQEAWRVRGRPLDMLRADLITVVGLLGVLSHFFADANKWLALVPLGLLSFRTFMNYRRVKVGSSAGISSMLFDRCLDKDAALMRLLPDAAEAQVFAECAVAYWVLLEADRNGAANAWVDAKELTRRAAEVVREMVAEAGLPPVGIRPSLNGAWQRLQLGGFVQASSADLRDPALRIRRRRVTHATSSQGAGELLWEGM